MSETTCPCDPERLYHLCCEPFHLNQAIPERAEQLMRSRYSAFVYDLYDYLLKTHHPKRRPARYELEDQSERSFFTRLEIIACSQGQAADKIGKVEFKAYFKQAGQALVLHERSRFCRYQGRWSYWDGEMMVIQPDK